MFLTKKALPQSRTTGEKLKREHVKYCVDFRFNTQLAGLCPKSITHFSLPVDGETGVMDFSLYTLMT